MTTIQLATTGNLIDGTASSLTLDMPLVDMDGNPLSDGITCDVSFGGNIASLTWVGSFQSTPPPSAGAGHTLSFKYSINTLSWWNTGSSGGMQGFTVAALNLAYPPASNQGMKAYVTDASGPGFLSTLVGAGAVVCPAFCNGTHWVAG